MTAGRFVLIPHINPALEAGTYRIDVGHGLQVIDSESERVDLNVDGAEFKLRIVSPRFVMPPDQILSTFPPASAVGDWRERLPQIVFKRRTLPWERTIDGLPDAPVTPWLALVVLAEGEGLLSEPAPISEYVADVDALGDDVDTERGRYLDVKESVVRAVFPTIEDLRLLCHVRQVDLSDTELAMGDDDGYLAVVMANRLPQPGPPAEPGGPPTARRYTACLVNLEHHREALPTPDQIQTEEDFRMVAPDLLDARLALDVPDLPLDALTMYRADDPREAPERSDTGSAERGVDRSLTGTRVERASASHAVGPIARAAVSFDDASRSKAAIYKDRGLAALGLTPGLAEPRVRFPVLASWDFVCTPDGGFERLMNTLDSAMLGSIAPETDAALTPEVAETGHISLDHTTRRGDGTTAWYRGPLVPQPTAREVADGLAHTGDQLRRVVPDGREDVSRAAAFEIGRLLALSKPGVVGAMLGWREELFGAARARRFAEVLAEPLLPGISARVLEGKTRLEDAIADGFVTRYAEEIPDRVGPRARPFESSRLPDAVAGLAPDAVLGGLGIDPARARAAIDRLDLQGLSTLDVQQAAPVEAPASASVGDLRSLRDALERHLDGLVSDTLRAGRDDGAEGELDGLDRFLGDGGRGPEGDG